MRRCAVAIILLCWALPASAMVVDLNSVWTGPMSFDEEVRVLPGVTLTIKPGAVLTFHGVGMEVAGTLVATDVEFSGKNWSGLVLKGSDATTRLTNCLIKGAKTGLLVQGGAPELAGLSLVANTVGVELRGKAAGRVINSSFVENRKVGLFIKDDSTTEVTACRFEGNAKFGAYLYRARPRSFRENAFHGNDTALMVAYHGSDPEISHNEFVGNAVAVLVDRAARPVIKENLLRQNQTGLYAYRRSDPVVASNRFDSNELAIQVAYSSYPQILDNDFVDNRLSLKLEFQSAAWEAQRGAQARAGEASAHTAFGGRGMRTVTEEDRRARSLDGTIDARNNWWGIEGTLELQRSGISGNPSFIHDGRDQATFVDAGEAFPLDKVTYQPWRDAPVAGRKE